MSEFTPLEQLTVSIPGAGRRTLLACLPDELCCPENFRLCVLDATRMDAPAQIALLDELAAQPGLEVLFALNKADRLGSTQNAVNSAAALLRERGFSTPRLWPVCACAARLFGLSREDPALRPKEIKAQGEFFNRFAPGRNSLSALCVTDETVCLLDGRSVNAEQLRLAKINTGVPALEAALQAAAAGSESIGDGCSVQSLPLEGKVPPKEADEVVPRQETASDELLNTTDPTLSVTAAPCHLPLAGKAEPAAEAVPADPLETAIDHALDRLDEGEAGLLEKPAVDLAPLLELAEKADCATLLEMARNVQNGEDPAAYREQALDAIHAAYKRRETEELDALTAELDGMELPALRSAVEKINAGAYTVQARSPYLQKLNAQIEARIRKQLDALCADVETVDAQTLARIRQEIGKADCAETLKQEYYRLLEERQDQLDVENLERITAGAEQMTEKELRTVAVTLEANNWNPKFVTRYRHKIALCRETTVFQDLERELDELNDMERREILALREQIARKELAPRFVAAPLAQIDEKLYRTDMLRLMALNNDFDLLDFDGLDSLRAQVARGDFSERARAEYLGRLREREEALVVENTDARAQVVRQLIGQHKLRMADFTFAGQTEAYRSRLNAYWGGSGMEQPRDIPVFLFDNASDYAMTGERFYYKTGKDLAFLPIAEIERFQTMKQHMSLLLQVVRKDNTYLLTSSKISRSGAERTLDFMNECLRRWNEPELVGARSASPIRTRRFEMAEYAAPVETRLPDATLALELLQRRCDGERIREGTLFRGEADWNQRIARLLAAFGLPETAPIVWYDTSGLLGSIRDGVAVGPRAIYWKDSKQAVQIIPVEEIYAMERNGKQLTVTTLNGQKLCPEMPAAMIAPVEDYVRAVQLGLYLRDREKKA